MAGLESSIQEIERWFIEGRGLIDPNAEAITSERC